MGLCYGPSENLVGWRTGKLQTLARRCPDRASQDMLIKPFMNLRRYGGHLFTLYLRSTLSGCYFT